MNKLLEPVCAALNTERMAHAYPLLQLPGLRDEAVLVHSMGCSFWTILGHELGFCAMVEAPAPSALGSDIRSDCAWFERNAWRPVALVEFERFEGGPRGQSKLMEKLRNLLEAAGRWQIQPELLVLSAWNVGVVSAPSLTAFSDLLRWGFTNGAGARVSGCPETPLLFHRLIFCASAGGRVTLDRSQVEVLP